eukprot:Opistho-2@15257
MRCSLSSSSLETFPARTSETLMTAHPKGRRKVFAPFLSLSSGSILPTRTMRQTRYTSAWRSFAPRSTKSARRLLILSISCGRPPLDSLTRYSSDKNRSSGIVQRNVYVRVLANTANKVLHLKQKVMRRPGWLLCRTTRGLARRGGVLCACRGVAGVLDNVCGAALVNFEEINNANRVGVQSVARFVARNHVQIQHAVTSVDPQTRLAADVTQLVFGESARNNLTAPSNQIRDVLAQHCKGLRFALLEKRLELRIPNVKDIGDFIANNIAAEHDLLAKPFTALDSTLLEVDVVGRENAMIRLVANGKPTIPPGILFNDVHRLTHAQADLVGSIGGEVVDGNAILGVGSRWPPHHFRIGRGSQKNRLSLHTIHRQDCGPLFSKQ